MQTQFDEKISPSNESPRPHAESIWITPAWQRGVMALAGLLVLAAVVISLVHPQPGRPAKPGATPTAQPAALPAAATVVNGRVVVAQVGVKAWVDVTPNMRLGKKDMITTWFVKPQVGWTFVATGSSATSTTVTAWRTVDGGETWHQAVVAQLVHGASLLATSFVSETHGWLLVSFSETGSDRPGTLFETRDGGLTWQQLPAPSGGAMTFTSDTTGWITGGRVNFARNLLFVTHDGGKTWAQVTLAMPAGFTVPNIEMTTPTFTSPRDGVFAANLETEVALYATHDGGQTWVPGAAFPVPAQDRAALPALLATEKQLIVFAGSTAQRSTDGGKTWAAMPQPDKRKVFAIGQIGDGSVWAQTVPAWCSAEFFGRCDSGALYVTGDEATWASPKLTTPTPE